MHTWGYASEKLWAAIATLAKHPGQIHARLNAALPDLIASSATGKMPNEETQKYHDRIMARVKGDVSTLSVTDAQAMVQDVLSLEAMLATLLDDDADSD